MRLGWFRPVHCKSMGAQETRAVLTARKLVQSKLRDVENSLRGTTRWVLRSLRRSSNRFARRRATQFNFVRCRGRERLSGRKIACAQILI
jgi:hypothetical protein